MHLVQSDTPSPLEPLRFSRLKLMGRSPAHYAAYVETPPTAAMEVGIAADRLIFEQGRVLAYPGPTRRGKEFDAFCALNPDAMIVTQKDGEKAYRLAEAVTNCPDAMRLLQGRRQETLYWNFNGRECRGTVDVAGADFNTDLKTSETSDPRFFSFKVRRFAYHAQMAFYETGRMVLERPVTQSYIVAVEQDAPHVVTVYRLTDRTIELGARLFRLWMEQLRVCEESGNFPPYSQSIVDLDLTDDEEAIDIGDAVEVVESTR